MEFETLRLDIDDGVARITFNRPDAANAINLDLARDLWRAALHCDENREVRAVILTGRGRVFCGGGDLRMFAEKGDQLPHYAKEVTNYLHTAISLLTRMDAPVVAAVNGGAGGAGMSLVCACDLVLAADNAKFTMSYTRVGLSPDGSSTYFLSRHVGLRRALELALTNRVLTAQEALDWGIINQMVPADQLLGEAEKLAASLSNGPTRVFGRTKRLLQAGLYQSLETQMELEARAIADAAREPAAREGITAFLEKRTPNFGRG